MADITGLGGLAPPRFSTQMAPEDQRAIRSYLAQLNEQLLYVLTNLDWSNLSGEMYTTLQNACGKGGAA